MGSSTWSGFKAALLPSAVDGEWVDEIKGRKSWDINAIIEIGAKMAEAAAEVWYE
jgi:hypothetical protein